VIPVLLALLLVPLATGPLASDRARYNACLAVVPADPARAIAIAQAWRVENGGVPARHCQGLAEAEKGDFAAAAKTLTGAARASEAAGDGQAATIYVQAADAAQRGDDPATAIAAIDNAIRLTGGGKAEAPLRLTRAEALVDLKREREAAVDLDTALKLDPDVEWGWLLKATLARRLGDLAGAEAAILEAGKRDANSADVQLEAGNIAAAQGKDQLARTAWGAAAAADPEGPAGKAAMKALTGD